MIQVYLLTVCELRRRMEETTLAGGKSDMFALRGWDRLALWQQEKVSRCAQSGARALCMGGQLLLQYGAHRRFAAGERETDRDITWQSLSYPQLLEDISAPLSLQVAYEPQGKPYIADVPWHYNLSHSGDYVALAVGDVPVGIDIQQMQPYGDSLVRRFFSEEEAAAHERFKVECKSECCDRTALFYTLWCRKEAYGKLKGTGLTEEVLKRNMLEDVGVHLYEYGGIPGYRVCVCSGEI